MANILAVVAFVVGVVTTASGLVVWTAVLFPGPVSRSRNRLERSPLMCLAWGAFAVAVAVAVLVILLPQRDAGFRLFGDALTELAATTGLSRFSNDARVLTHLSGWLVLAPLMVWWVLGGTGLAALFADRVCPGWSGAARVAAVGCGGACTHASYFLPFVGWFVFLPVVGCASVGAGLLATFARPTGAGTPQPARSAELVAAGDR